MGVPAHGLFNETPFFFNERLEFAHLSLVLVLTADQDVLELFLAGSGRNEMTADDVLLQAFEVVNTATDSGLAENLRGLLEGCGGDEAVGTKSRAGDTLEHKLGCGGFRLAGNHHLQALTLERRILVPQITGVNDVTLHVPLAVARVKHEELAEDRIVHIHELPLVHEFLMEEVSVAGISDLNLAHHLAYDDLEVLVVDLHTLQTVDSLNLVDNVVLRFDRSEDVEDVGRGDASVGQFGTCLDIVILLYENLLGGRNEVVLLDTGLILDDDVAVTPLDLAHQNLTVDLRENRGG